MTGKEFSEMVGAMQGKLFRFAYHFLDDIQEAEDAVQDSLTKFWEKRENLNGVLKPEAFLMTVVKNQSLDRIKGKKKDSLIAREASEAFIDFEDPLEERIIKLRRAIRSLPENFRSVIHLRDVEGLRYEEIEKILGLSLSDVKIRIHRGRKMLREMLIQQ